MTSHRPVTWQLALSASLELARGLRRFCGFLLLADRCRAVCAGCTRLATRECRFGVHSRDADDPQADTSGGLAGDYRCS